MFITPSDDMAVQAHAAPLLRELGLDRLSELDPAAIRPAEARGVAERIGRQARNLISKITDDAPEDRAAEIEAAFDALMSAHDSITETHREARARAARRPLTRGSASGIDLPDALAEMRSVLRGETRALSGVTATAGGNAVPAEIDRIIQDELRDISPMRRVAEVVASNSGDYTKLVSTGGAGSGWAAEDDTRSATSEPDIQAVQPPGGEVYAYASASRWLLEDAVFDVSAWLRDNVTTAFGVAEGAAFVGGDGADKPKGLTSYTTAATADGSRTFGTLEHVLAASPTAVTGDELIGLVYKVRPVYRQGEGVGWMMNSTTASAIRKLKDADGRYLWTDSLAAGQPPTLLGWPVIEAEDMPDMGADALPIAFGNFRRGYLIADRAGLTMVRDEISQPGYVKFYFARRVYGAVTDSSAIKFLKMAAA
ncbi:MAG: phage major capsid protein [Paracoccaceae bacterium]